MRVLQGDPPLPLLITIEEHVLVAKPTLASRSGALALSRQ